MSVATLTRRYDALSLPTQSALLALLLSLALVLLLTCPVCTLMTAAVFFLGMLVASRVRRAVLARYDAKGWLFPADQTLSENMGDAAVLAGSMLADAAVAAVCVLAAPIAISLWLAVQVLALGLVVTLASLALVVACVWLAIVAGCWLASESRRQYRRAVTVEVETAIVSFARFACVEVPTYAGRDASRWIARQWTASEPARAAAVRDLRENALGAGENLGTLAVRTSRPIGRAVVTSARAVKQWSKAGSSARPQARAAAIVTQIPVATAVLEATLINAQAVPARHYPSIAQDVAAMQAERPWDADISDEQRAIVEAYSAHAEDGEALVSGYESDRCAIGGCIGCGHGYPSSRPCICSDDLVPAGSPKCSTPDCYAEATEWVEGREPMCEACADRVDCAEYDATEEARQECDAAREMALEREADERAWRASAAALGTRYGRTRFGVERLSV